MNTTRACVNLIKRGFRSSAPVKSGHWDEANAPGQYLPFSIKNRYKLAIGFVLYFGSGMGIPFFVVRRHLLKGNGPDLDEEEE